VIYGGGWTVKVGLEEMGSRRPVPRAAGPSIARWCRMTASVLESTEPVISLDLSLKQGWVKLSAKSGSSPLAG